MSSSTSASRADTTTSDDDSFSGADPVASADHFYSEAVAFERILANNGLIEDRPDSANGFEELVAKHLSPREVAVATHAAKISAAGTTPSWTPSPTSSILEEEPESYLEGDDASVSTESSGPLSDVEPVLHRAATLDTDEWKFDAETVVSMLIDEFGALAPEGEEEKLILETDGGLLKEVSIIGVIHLTTHRLCFHASLMAANPNPQTTILRAGPAVIHRPGLRFSRRLWMELSPDMLCSYASSKDKDRLKPVRTLLLSAIHGIVPFDPKRPKCIQLIFDEQFEREHVSGFAEFDTEESAVDWRKELSGALFLYRHQRREAIDSGNSENGIRWSCPLSHIASAEFLDPKMPGIATLSIDVGAPDGPRKVRMGCIYEFPAWSKLPEIVADYHKFRESRPSELDETPIFVDMGPISFAETIPTVPVTNMKEDSVRKVLGLSAEKSFWMTKARLYRTIASGGVFVVTDNYVGFWAKFLTQQDARYRLHVSLIREAKPFSLLRGCSYGLAIELEGLPDLRFQFRTVQGRTDAMERVNALVKHAREAPQRPTALALSHSSSSSSDTSLSSGVSTPTRSMTGLFSPLARTFAAVQEVGAPPSMRGKFPKLINIPSQLLVKSEKKHFVCLTIGSRGDVQPYIALGLGLMKEGHEVTIVTHDEYKPWVESFGITHKQAGGDPGALMKLSVENKMFSPEFFKESLQNFRPWLDQLLIDSWESCQGADVLLESPSAMAGVHIAEALNIPYFRTFTMPWTKTSDFPHAFLSVPVDAPTFNSASYVLFNSVMWTATSGQINRWRKHTLQIPHTDLSHLDQGKIAFIYNFSTAVVPKPLDWGDAINVSGYWFLDNPEGANWTPPEDLVHWMDKARSDGKPIVYIGFGSITVPNPNRVTARIVKAVLKSGVRAIISKGWSARMSKANDKGPEVEIPEECYVVNSIPHDWLFQRIDAAMHHGGAGTTGASLRAGIPTLIKPWFGDQFFWASRVQHLGAGLRVPSLHSHDLADALITATTNRVMKEKAAAVGEKIRAEDGVHTAIHTMYIYMQHAGAYIEKIRDHSH
ncbi:Glycosyltransferase family 1 protein [Mycena indigotica]|uniref:sterol 3beta-glucosyltransferase n=1 Tax=Mycena indigotica TaxID=2126181 RepID=A0A8H6SIS5_9AGAR|nr:Glycosyltransferase family 1 protein [Mycena indigotica]KAF7299097.1 Glycosyltransferase family 1 protein [Mycena indigotica]